MLRVKIRIWADWVVVLVLGVSDVIKLYEVVTTFTKQVFDKFEADDWVKRANRYYREGIDDLALICLDKTIEMNNSDNEKRSQLYLLKGDLFTSRGMYLFKNDVECKVSFEASIIEFEKSIKIDPFNSVAWMGKGFSQLMLALQANEDAKSDYYTYEAIFSIEAGLGVLQDSVPYMDLESNLWGLKGAAYYMIGKFDEGDKCFKKENVDTQISKSP